MWNGEEYSIEELLQLRQRKDVKTRQSALKS